MLLFNRAFRLLLYVHLKNMARQLASVQRNKLYKYYYNESYFLPTETAEEEELDITPEENVETSGEAA